MECQTGAVLNSPVRGTLFMEIVLNGEKAIVPENISVQGLLQHLQVDPSRVAIEINRQLVKKTTWETFQVSSADEVEIVHFVGGGTF